jgi:hypothetical protein
MKPHYKNQSPPATVIVRRRSVGGSGAAAPSGRARCGHPLDRGRSPSKDCRSCCQAKVNADRARGHQNRVLAAQAKRLPDGSSFQLAWDATSMQWTGTLVVPGDCFTDRAGSVITLLRRLDRRYRASLPENTALVAQTAALAGASL